MKRFFVVILFFILFLPIGSKVHAATPVTSPFGTDSLLDGVTLKWLATGVAAPEITDRDSSTYIDTTNSTYPTVTYTFPEPVGIRSLWNITTKTYAYINFTFSDGTQSTNIGIVPSTPLINLNLTKPVKSFKVFGKGGSAFIHELDLGRYPDTTPPVKPNGLSALPYFDQVQLKWITNADPDIFGYNVYVDGVKKNTLTIKQNNYIVGLSDYTKVYSFYVTALDSAGNESVPSDVVTSTPIEPPDTTPPSRPYGLKAIGEVGQVRLSWAANIEPDLAGYLVYKDGLLLFTTPINVTDFLVTGGLSYVDDSEFSIVAVDLVGNVSMRSTVVKVKPIKPVDNTPPPIPIGLKAAITPDSLKIQATWDATIDPDLDGYYVYISKDGGNNWTRTNPPPVKSNSYRIEPIDPDTEYQIKVTSIDMSGNESAFSNTVTIKTPKNTTVVNPGIPGIDYIDISWLPIPGAVKYLIFYNGKQVGEAAAGTTTFRITKSMGYNKGSMVQVFDVKAQFANGSIGGGSNQPGKPLGSGWGFNAADIFTNSMWLIASVSSLVLFGLVMKFTPKLVNLIKKTAIQKRKGMG